MGGVASSIAALGNGIGPGDLGVIRVSQGGEDFELLLVWDDTNSRWVSEPLAQSIESVDGAFVSNINHPYPSWSYISSGSTDLAKWFLRGGSIPFVGALYAAGMKLQDRAVGRLYDGGSAVGYVSPWFYEYDNQSPILFDNDNGGGNSKTWNGFSDASYGFQPSSANIGHGCVLKSNGLDTFLYATDGQYEDNIATSGYHNLTRGTGWDDVKFFTATQPVGAALGGVPTSTPHTPTKKYLYPTLYGYGFSAAGQGAAAYYWECRWVSA